MLRIVRETAAGICSMIPIDFGENQAPWVASEAERGTGLHENELSKSR